MMNTKVQNAINDQIAQEFFASYLYLSMMIYFEGQSLGGFAHWMRMQAEEERAHALKLLEFLIERGGRVELQAIDKPAADFESPLAVMQSALAHEQKVTKRITDLYELVVAERDYPAQVMLQWFITEQVEEEASAGAIVDQLTLAGDSGSTLLMLDAKLGQRAGME
ncbi:MAG: ferritin [Gemmatimonadota bacterium]|jgi:ferritin|nr:MAG: ferritin [Gemmatimonadota bacterium]